MLVVPTAAFLLEPSSGKSQSIQPWLVEEKRPGDEAICVVSSRELDFGVGCSRPTRNSAPIFDAGLPRWWWKRNQATSEIGG